MLQSKTIDGGRGKTVDEQQLLIEVPQFRHLQRLDGIRKNAPVRTRTGVGGMALVAGPLRRRACFHDREEIGLSSDRIPPIQRSGQSAVQVLERVRLEQDAIGKGGVE